VIVLDYGRSQSPIRRVNLSEFNTFVHEQRTRWGPQSPIDRVNLSEERRKGEVRMAPKSRNPLFVGSTFRS